MNTETVKIEADNAKGFRIINRSSFDPEQHKVHKDEALYTRDALSDEERKMHDEDASRRKVQGNRGQTDGGGVVDTTRNPSGTYSEPTPTDIRYPNKLATEFENNLGAHIGKSAAQMREANDLPDAPGGLMPQEAAAGGDLTKLKSPAEQQAAASTSSEQEAAAKAAEVDPASGAAARMAKVADEKAAETTGQEAQRAREERDQDAQRAREREAKDAQQAREGREREARERAAQAARGKAHAKK